MSQEYQSGICNIGDHEITYRRRVIGYGSGFISLALYIMLAYFNFPLAFYFVLLISVFISVHGFIQAKSRFCTSYAKAGKYNMSSEVGTTQDVLNGAKRKRDANTANRLIGQSIRLSVLITLALTALSRLFN